MQPKYLIIAGAVILVSHDLEEAVYLADRHDAIVMVDDSHATGFVGKTGRGSAELRNCMSRVDVFTSTLGKALGHPARVRILRLLVRRETCVCGDIVDELPLAQSTVSQHLKVLKEAGLVNDRPDGARRGGRLVRHGWRRRCARRSWGVHTPPCA